MSATLRSLLAALGEPLVEVVTAPRGLDVGIAGVAIADPDDELDQFPDQLVLLIGARGREADRLVRALARRGGARLLLLIPAFVSLGVYAIAGKVAQVSDGQLTLIRQETGEEVIVTLGDLDVTAAVGDEIIVYTTGVATLSLPAQVNAIGVAAQE